MSHTPLRTCVGCGRRVPRDELIRFVAVSGTLTEGRALPGRGAYTCRKLACFEQACELRRFARTLRVPVEIERALARLYTDADG